MFYKFRTDYIKSKQNSYEYIKSVINKSDISGHTQ